MIELCIGAISSNSGKTILTSALLYHYRDSVRPYKIGPDFIDPKFQKRVCGSDSLNLDTFMMSEDEVRWIYENYSNRSVSIIEGVMGFYDGEDRGCSTYSISKLLDVPTIIILDAKGSYITISAILKGLKEYKNDNTIKGVVLNNISSQNHYELIKNILESDHLDIEVVGWIRRGLKSLKSTHLGLSSSGLSEIEEISKEVLENIDLKLIEKIGRKSRATKIDRYPFLEIPKSDKKIAVVYDENFSFLYYDNLKFLEEIFLEVLIVDSTKDEEIPLDVDVVYICGGYVETEESYAKIKDSKKFKNSLKKHAKSKKVYAECAGLLYLGGRVDAKVMSGILDVDFTLQKSFQRLGYYYNEDGIKGHAFHYTSTIGDSNGCEVLYKSGSNKSSIGSYQDRSGAVFGTYLHTFFRPNSLLIKKRFL